MWIVRVRLAVPLAVESPQGHIAGAHSSGCRKGGGWIACPAEVGMESATDLEADGVCAGAEAVWCLF